MERTFKVGELNALIAESSEFKPVLGKNVESEDKSNNDKAYKDAKKRAKDYDGGGDEAYWKGKAKYEKQDGNGTTIDYEPENATKDYIERVRAQVHGYTSKAEENNGIEKSGDHDDNKDFYDETRKKGKKYHANKKILKRSGLQARCFPAETFDEGKDEMYESVRPTAWFKKTTFLTEGHMVSLIPDELKVEGKQFNMKDKTENTYIVEWKENKAVIIGHDNKNGMNESLNRMKELMGYKTEDTKTTSDIRVNEGDERLKNTLDKMRRIIN
jgi:hypothetical protein